MRQEAQNRKAGLIILALASLCLTLWVVFARVIDMGDAAAERAVSCDAGAFFTLQDLRLFIAPEYMQAVFAQGTRAPVNNGNDYTCADVGKVDPLPVKNLRFFPEAFLNKNILINNAPMKAVLPIVLRRVPAEMRDRSGTFSCNDAGQCVAAVVKGDVYFMQEISESYFASSLQKDIFYAAFHRFIEDMILDDAPVAAE